MISRFAPTPSGYLHEGNAVNALLVHWLARSHHGTVLLRIDDMDVARTRTEYVHDIHGVLEWLGIDWTPAPRLVPADYREALWRASRNGLEVYACSCSRRQLGGMPAVGGCPGGCRQGGLEHVAQETALRVHVPVGTTIRLEGQAIDLAERVGDFVVWRREDLPAYQLTSVVDDLHHGVTHVVRGLDLLDSTAAQLFLAQYLADDFGRTRFIHHPLITDPSGSKLSKSQVSHGVPLPRTDAKRGEVLAAAAELGRPCGISPPDGLRSHA